MNPLADRHRGTLGGRLRALGDAQVIVGVRIEPDCAARPSVQHTAWMVVNLLTRLVGVVTEIRLDGDDADLRGPVVPLSGERTLRAALLDGAEAVGAVAVRSAAPESADIMLHLGPGAGITQGWRVHGEGFCGALSRHGIASTTDSALPFGPYIAACLAAGEIFRYARMTSAEYRPVERLSFSAWDYTTGAGNLHAVGDPLMDNLELDLGIAGIGAVGCAVVHTLWACRGLTGRAVLADPDPDGIETTNLNRCVLFGRRHLGQPKASTAAEVCRAAQIAWQPLDLRYTPENVVDPPPFLVSAVDTNRSRNQLQQGFWPARLYGASTKDLRAEVLRAGPPGRGPCLRCNNPPEVDVPDDVVRAGLRDMGETDLEALAAAIGRPVEVVRRWGEEGGCGEVGDAVLARLRPSEGGGMFSVGFVSVLAGTLLAAEVVKEHAGIAGPLDDGHQCVKFQFLNPDAQGNGHPTSEERDPRCPACAPDAPAVRVWHQRAARFGSPAS